MSMDNSVVLICTAADRAAVNQAISAFYGDAPNSPELSRALCPLTVGGVPLDPENATPTAWAGAAWFDNFRASELKDWPTGVLPTTRPNGDPIDWSPYDLDETSALAACANLKVQVLVGADPDTGPLTNLHSLMASLGLQFVVYPM